MTIRHLRIFITVHDKQTMTLAANELFMTQPSVSQAIKDLENYYGVILFERLSHKLYLTESGKRLYQYATHIIKLFDELEESMKANALRNNLVIGANYTVGNVLIDDFILRFKKIYPLSEVRVHINKASVLTDMLRSNKLDLSLMEQSKDPEFIQDVFFHDRIVVVASPSHPLCTHKTVTPADLVNEHLLLREKGAGVRNLFEAKMNQLGFSFSPYWESTSTTALINAAVRRLGVAVLPAQLVHSEIDAGQLQELPLSGIDLSRNLAIFYHKNKFMTNAIAKFIEICHQST